MSEKKKIYFVGNAHLDPVWMWRWQEGSAEAKATIRSALDRMKEYPEFKFVCSAAAVFEWIEEFDPEMFEEVKKRVDEGRFIIVGGWYIQPDCNNPSGESFARHGLYAQRYFKERFGKTARVGYNVDSFGHNAMIPQILKKSGMDRYIFMRPGISEKDMPSELFKWQSPDGSQVLAWKIVAGYTGNVKNIEDLEKKFEKAIAVIRNETDAMMLFYGVGNHGGGPTKTNINTVLEFREKYPDREIIFSSAEDFFDYIEPFADSFPVHEDDLQHHASGCYAAVSFIKNAIRKSENAMYSAEIFAFMANRIMNKTLDPRSFENAWKNILFCHFHDIMGGCSIKDAYTDAGYMIGESMSFAMKTENNALQSLSWAIDTRDTEKGLPVIVFNPHSFEVEDLITINKQVERICDEDGNDLPIQFVHSQTFSCKVRSDTAFVAKVPAMGYTTYYIKKPEPVLVDEPASVAEEDLPEQEPALRIEGTAMENEIFRIEFEKHTGYIKSIYDKVSDRELIEGYGAVPTVYDEFKHDTWSHKLNFFDREVAKFADAELKIVESGPIRVTMKVVSRYNGSTLTQYISLRSGAKTIDVKANIDWHEKHKMLKLAYGTVFTDADAYYEIPFGVICRPTDGEEEPGLSFIALRKNDTGLAMLNNNKYSFSLKDNVMNLTVVRSPLYADHGRGRDDECEFTDQGSHDFSYSLMPLRQNGWSEVVKEAKKLNLPMTYIMENNHNGTLAHTFRGFECSCPNVVVSALKIAEDKNGIVLRAYETDGAATDARIAGSLLPAPLNAHFGAHSVNTYYYSFETKKWKEVLMTEYDV
ncbi:MAG: alpha-mannosidase [Clostridia bacterium]|nr:alpha-mannosidase [Clostridia bacterium]